MWPFTTFFSSFPNGKFLLLSCQITRWFYQATIHSTRFQIVIPWWKPSKKRPAWMKPIWNPLRPGKILVPQPEGSFLGTWSIAFTVGCDGNHRLGIRHVTGYRRGKGIQWKHVYWDTNFSSPASVGSWLTLLIEPYLHNQEDNFMVNTWV